MLQNRIFVFLGGVDGVDAIWMRCGAIPTASLSLAQTVSGTGEEKTLGPAGNCNANTAGCTSYFDRVSQDVCTYIQ